MSYPQAILIAIGVLIACLAVAVLLLPYLKYIPLFWDVISEWTFEIIKLLLRNAKTMVNLKEKDIFAKDLHLMCQDDEFKDVILSQKEYIELLIKENEKLREYVIDSVINK